MIDWRVTFNNCGKVGADLREFDWSTAPLGQPEGWPEALRVSLSVVLNANHPMLIWWGDELTQFYNDAFEKIARPFVRSHGLGASGKECWREISDLIDADIKYVVAGKGRVRRQRQLMRVAADDKQSHRYWTYSLSPINDRDEVGGVLFVCQDETDEHRATLARKSREAEFARIQHVGKFGGLEVDLTSGFHNRRSPEYLVIHGLPPSAEHETHENWVSRIHREDRCTTEQTFIKAVRGDCKGYSIQYRIVRPSDEKVRWISAKTEIERDNAGRAMRLVGVHTDVTDQVDVRAIEHARFTAALDLLRYAVMLTDANGGIVYKNRSADDILNKGLSVRSRHNVIRATRPAATQELSAALKLAARADVRIGNAGWVVRLSDDDALPIMAHVLPLAGIGHQDGLEPSAVAAIFIRDWDDTGENAKLLATTHRLTLAETRLLSCILAGRNLSEATTELRVSTSTVKTQLKSIFRKTGVGRQSELILLASRLSVPVFGSWIFPDLNRPSVVHGDLNSPAAGG
jgi:PAS domain-containing protein/DNA-binding CsgD family transcriptional regulator